MTGDELKVINERKNSMVFKARTVWHLKKCSGGIDPVILSCCLDGCGKAHTRITYIHAFGRHAYPRAIEG